MNNQDEFVKSAIAAAEEEMLAAAEEEKRLAIERGDVLPGSGTPHILVMADGTLDEEILPQWMLRFCVWSRRDSWLSTRKKFYFTAFETKFAKFVGLLRKTRKNPESTHVSKTGTHLEHRLLWKAML